eukprot:1138947-Pelagomonas_calceolata.AAC.2
MPRRKDYCKVKLHRYICLEGQLSGYTEACTQTWPEKMLNSQNYHCKKIGSQDMHECVNVSWTSKFKLMEFDPQTESEKKGKETLSFPGLNQSNRESIQWIPSWEGHADTNLANPRTSAWFVKSLRHDALLGGAELKSVPIAFVANSKLVWSPISMMPLGFHSKIVTGKA